MNGTSIRERWLRARFYILLAIFALHLVVHWLQINEAYDLVDRANALTKETIETTDKDRRELFCRDARVDCFALALKNHQPLAGVDDACRNYWIDLRTWGFEARDACDGGWQVVDTWSKP